MDGLQPSAANDLLLLDMTLWNEIRRRRHLPARRDLNLGFECREIYRIVASLHVRRLVRSMNHSCVRPHASINRCLNLKIFVLPSAETNKKKWMLAYETTGLKGDRNI